MNPHRGHGRLFHKTTTGLPHSEGPDFESIAWVGASYSSKTGRAPFEANANGSLRRLQRCMPVRS